MYLLHHVESWIYINHTSVHIYCLLALVTFTEHWQLNAVVHCIFTRPTLSVTCLSSTVEPLFSTTSHSPPTPSFRPPPPPSIVINSRSRLHMALKYDNMTVFTIYFKLICSCFYYYYYFLQPNLTWWYAGVSCENVEFLCCVGIGFVDWLVKGSLYI